MYRLISALVALLLCLPALGQQEPNNGALSREAEQAEAVRQAQAVQQVGPADISLGEQAALKLLAGRIFIPMPEAGRLMRAMGNSASEGLLGMVFPADGGHWVAIIRFDKAGYVKDDDAKDWNADELLKNLREGTEAANEDRRQRGFPELEVLGWVEKPAYEAAAHRLVWSAEARQKDAPADKESSVNYNTYALGREGYVSINLIDARSRIDGDKPVARELLSSLEFKDGKRYGDFNSSTDKVAEYGLAALVAGVAAKKLGLLALAAGFLVKFWKLLAVGAVVASGGLAKLFGRKKDDTPPSA